MSKKLLDKYEAQHVINLFQLENEINAILRLPEKEIIELAKRIKSIQTSNKQLQGKLDLAQKKLQRALNQTFNKYDSKSRRLSDEKIKALLYDAFRKPAVDVIIAKEFVDGSDKAANIFARRAKEGFNLSERVWNLTKQKRFELDMAVRTAIDQGLSAKELGEQIQKYLRDPNKMFRRVRDKDGNLVESPAKKKYKPGRGVYRTAEANAQRLARTEINMAYRAADFERWKGMPMVVGIMVKLSNRHPIYDICDQLKGKYPKDFKFTGWHPNCLCHAEPVLMDEKSLNDYEDYILGIRDEEPNFKNITNVPAGFKTWLSDNKDRVKKWASKPYWMLDNKQYLK